MREQHRRWVANHLLDKVGELQFFLKLITDGADASARRFQTKEPLAGPDFAKGSVVSGFAAFANTVQALKDAIRTCTGEDITWGQIGLLRHGAFFKEARNASTHDGHPIINAWIEGRFRVLLQIVRFHGSEKIVIDPPRVDVPTMCAEFAADFTDLLAKRLEPHRDRAELLGSRFTEAEYDGYANSPFVPEDARRLLQEERAANVAQILASKADPISAAIEKLFEVNECATAMLPARRDR